jgi:autotransporter-associated beta strand protein
LELDGGITIGAEALGLSGTGISNGGALRNISGINSYGGDITLNAASRIHSDAGRLTLSGNISGTQNLTLDGAGNITLSGAVRIETGTLTKNGAGTLVLSGSSNYSGGTTLNLGNLTIQHANALGTGSLTQSSGASLLTFDTTGTISNAMSLYNVSALQSATLNGTITVNNATFDVDSGDTLTLSGGVGGTGGVTKNGTGTLVLSGSNTYSGATVVNAGTLNAANANALGTNASVTVHGGSLLVSADDAINSKNLILASTATGNGTAAGLVFSGNYNGTASSLTLNQDSIIDLGTGDVTIRFTSIVGLETHSLSIYNWTGNSLWAGGDGNNTDQFYINSTLSQGNLDNISFYSGLDNSSFVGTGFQIIGGSFNQQIIPVPEPETYATALLLLLGLGLYFYRQRRPQHTSPL